MVKGRGKKRGVWAEVCHTVVGLGFVLVFCMGPGVVVGVGAEDGVKASSEQIDRRGMIAPPGFYYDGIPRRLLDAYVSRSDKRLTLEILFDELPEELRKHPAWWYVFACVAPKINKKAKMVFGDHIEKNGKERMFTMGVGNYVTLHEEGRGVPTHVEHALLLSLMGQSGEKVTDTKEAVNIYQSKTLQEKEAYFAAIEPSKLSSQDYDLLVWTVDALLVHYEKMNQTEDDTYIVLRKLKGEWKLPTVL